MDRMIHCLNVMKGIKMETSGELRWRPRGAKMETSPKNTTQPIV